MIFVRQIVAQMKYHNVNVLVRRGFGRGDDRAGNVSQR